MCLEVAKKVIAIYFSAGDSDKAPYTYDGRAYYKVENTTSLMPLEMFEERIKMGILRSLVGRKRLVHHSIPG